ncbi:class I SAM-dependent methyltransferase [Mucilaginibacter sp. UYCu711]|uniref:class I SAM-dependent methyltransferase n=1 Tax=Mucilaginibacter sp. UYCu711 TaxID=3156339 RepID=UPI003D238B33
MKKTLRWRVAQSFEARWWKKYLHRKDVSTYLKWKRGYWDNTLNLINKNLGMQAGQDVLDAGCGPAGVFIALPGYKITAFDPLLDTYHQTLPHFKKEMYPAVNFVTETLENFNSNTLFDMIFCMNAINHVSQLEEAFLKLYNQAKPGGRIIVSIDAHNRQFFKYFFRMQPADILHPHQYDLPEYEAMLTTLGCTILQKELIKKEFFFNHYILVAQKN